MNFPIATRLSMPLHQAAALAGVVMLATAVGLSLTVWSASGTMLSVVTGAVGVWVVLTLPQLTRFVKQLMVLRWWQVLLLLIFLSGLVLRVRTTEAAAENPLDAAAILRLSLVILVAIGLLWMIGTRKLRVITGMTSGLLLPLTFLSVLGLLSVLWSVNPPWTLYRSVEYSIDVALIAAIVVSFSSVREYKRLFDWTWLLLGLLLVVVGLNILLVPGQAIVQGVGIIGVRVQSVYPWLEPNPIGYYGALLAAVAFARLITAGRSRSAYLLLLSAMLLTLVLSQTRQAMAGLLLAAPLMLLASRRSGWLFAASTIGLAIALLTNLGDPIWDYLIRGQTQSELATLTGRVDLWSFSWDAFTERPLTGYGAFASRFVASDALGIPTLSSMLGTFPELLIGTGIWGVVLIMAVLVGAWLYLGRAIISFRASGAYLTEEWALAVEALGVLAVVTVRSFFSPSIVGPHPPLEFLIIVGYIEFLRRKARDSKTIRR